MTFQNEIKCSIEKHAALFFWFFHILAGAKSVSRNSQQGSTQEILELSPYSQPSTEPSYYNTTLNELETEGQFTYEVVDDVRSGQITHYDDIVPQQEDTYAEIDPGGHYQPLNVNRQVIYEGYVKPKPILGRAPLSNS